jgi:hypothetical protein
MVPEDMQVAQAWPVGCIPGCGCEKEHGVLGEARGRRPQGETQTAREARG